jgi:cell division topological specificity factor
MILLSISEFFERLFTGKSANASGTKVKQRLKFILAYDRAALTPQMFEAIRQEIMAVVSKYVELDQDSLEFRLESDNRLTALVANLPIRGIKAKEPSVLEVEPLNPDLESPLPTQNNGG